MCFSHLRPLLLWIQLWHSFPRPVSVCVALLGVSVSWSWSDFSLMKTLGGTACPLLPIFFLYHTWLCLYIWSVCVCVWPCMGCCLCRYFVKKQWLVLICSQTDSEAWRQAAGLWWSQGPVLCIHLNPPSLLSAPMSVCWTQGCGLMKRVWTTERGDSHLPDTSAHLWPTETLSVWQVPLSSTHSPCRLSVPWAAMCRLVVRWPVSTTHPAWYCTKTIDSKVWKLYQ